MRLTTPRQPAVPDPRVAREGWSPWQRLGGMLTARPTASLDRDGSLHVLAPGPEQRLWHAWQTQPGGRWACHWAERQAPPSIEDAAAWPGGHDLGHATRFLGAPVLTGDRNGRVQVFVRDSRGVTYHIWQNASQSWEAIAGGTVTSDVAVVRTAASRLEIFACHARGQLAHAWQTAPDGPWTSWVSISGSLDHATTPAVALDARGDVEVFVRWQDGSIRHCRMLQPDGDRLWLAWEDLRGVAKSDPVVAAAADGRLAVFVVGMDGALHVTEQRAPA
jgi:hypothetical protein